MTQLALLAGLSAAAGVLGYVFGTLLGRLMDEVSPPTKAEQKKFTRGMRRIAPGMREYRDRSWQGETVVIQLDEEVL